MFGALYIFCRCKIKQNPIHKTVSARLHSFAIICGYMCLQLQVPPLCLCRCTTPCAKTGLPDTKTVHCFRFAAIENAATILNKFAMDKARTTTPPFPIPCDCNICLFHDDAIVVCQIPKQPIATGLWLLCLASISSCSSRSSWCTTIAYNSFIFTPFSTSQTMSTVGTPTDRLPGIQPHFMNAHFYRFRLVRGPRG